MIQVRALGTAEVLVGSNRIAPDSSMLFALALFLSVSAGQRIQRSRLLDLLWPESNEISRRHALRQLLYRLRRSGFPLSLDGEELLVSEDVVESDLRGVLTSSWPDEASSEAVDAAATVLPGYDPPESEYYREWIDELRSRVSSQYRRALLHQIDAARRDGRWHDVDKSARHCLATDPLNEEATLAHAEAVAMSGSKTQALQIIDHYLHELGDRDRVIGLPAKVLRRRVSESSPIRSRGEPDSVPLIGREREVARLVDTLTATLSGRGSAVFIEGAAGIGKSRLAHELQTIATMRGWRTVCIRLQPSDAQRPLGLFVDLFGRLIELPGALGCSPASLSQLKLLTQHDVLAAAELHRSQEAEAVQDRLRTAGADLMESVVSEGPLVILVDDLHWCDEASVRLLQHLVGRSAGLPVMWALIARHEGRYGILREVLSEVRVDTIAVNPLTPEKANALFGLLAGNDHATRREISPDIASAVTGGNPLFVLELAMHVRETGQASSLPQTLRALIRDRSMRLSPLAQHVLHTCAILGRYSSVPRVSNVLEINTAELLACIGELDALGIVGAGTEAEALSLHDLWREELTKRLLPASRKLLHHRCGIVLENECRSARSPSMVWEAAQHLLASGSEGRALSLLEESAQHQLDNGLPADAANSYELAFQASSTDADRLRALTGRIAALQRAADWTQLSKIMVTAIELTARCSLQTSPHSDLELLETEVLWRTETNLSGSLERALTCALDASAPTSHRAEAALLAAIAADNTCRFEELGRLNGIVRSLPAAGGEVQSHVLSVRIVFETVLGSLEIARECSADLIALERRTGSVRGLCRALRFSCNPSRMLGDFDGALNALNEALELSERHHLVGEAASSADIILSIHLERADLKAARLWIARTETLATRVGARYARAGQATNQAIYLILQGDFYGAQRCIQPYAENYLDDPLIRQRMLSLSILARIHVAHGDFGPLAALEPSLKAALALRRRTGTHDFHVASYAHTLHALGNRRGAVDYVTEFVTKARRDRTVPSAELQSFMS